ncbi:uncharacterized protein LOC126900068 [Daktulosphaira vitifoliae]|uniref:uncharacterized protein LOC126900068 n=1 Tax=Daktulosphaira vitifoliae TaxID=58002 RepID=UPI0021AA8B60|nr:uncharacterized protein LOC126900068 [Daktulosphaira vitifoliae]
MLSTYLNKTFDPKQKCIQAIVDDAITKTTTLLPSLYQITLNNFSSPKTIELMIIGNETTSKENIHFESLCGAVVVIVKRLRIVKWALDEFQRSTAEQMLLMVILNTSKRKAIQLSKYTPKYFDYKDVVIAVVEPKKETIFRMDLEHHKFIRAFKHQERWIQLDKFKKQTLKNFYGAPMKLFTFNNSLFSIVNENSITKDIELGEGIECRIFKEISRRLNVTVNLISSKKHKWGQFVSSNGSWTPGSTKYLQDKIVDVALGSLWIEQNKFTFIDISNHWGYVCLKFLVSKPSPLTKKWGLIFKPFPLSLWLLLLVATMINTFTLWKIAVFQKKIGFKHVDSFTSLPNTIFLVFGMLQMTNLPVRPNRLGPIRHLISWWCIFMFIIATIFSSTLYSYITSPEYTKIVTSIEEMVKEGYTWGLPYDPPFKHLLQMKENPWHVLFAERFIPESNLIDRINRVTIGKYAVLTKCIYNEAFMEAQDLPPSLLSDLRTTRDCLNLYYIGIGFSKRSPYLKPSNMIIRRLVESGIIRYWTRRIFDMKVPSTTFARVYEQKPFTEKNRRPTPLTYHQFIAVLVVWLIGCIVSIIIFIFEYKYAIYYN